MHNITVQKTTGYAMVVHGRPKTPKNRSFWGSPSPQGSHSPYILGDTTTRPGHVTCLRLNQIGPKTAEKNSAQTTKQTNKQTDKQTLRK